MKLKLTEQQAQGIIDKLGTIDVEKDAPHLSKFINLLKGMGSDNKQSLIFGDKNPTDNIEKPVPIGKKLSPIVKTPVSNIRRLFSKNIPAGTEPMHPLGQSKKITSGFGKRNVSVGGKDHKGIDIATKSGSPVYAPLDGVVISSRDTTPNACGGFIRLSHANIDTKFCHLSQLLVREGQKVKKGQLIAYSGGGKNDPMRGRATGPHLHYEILNKGGIALNPIQAQPNLA